MQQMQELPCSSLGGNVAKICQCEVELCKNVKYHFCFFCARICKNAHVHIGKSTSVYLKIYL